jgi:hypothetical protein
MLENKILQKHTARNKRILYFSSFSKNRPIDLELKSPYVLGSRLNSFLLEQGRLFCLIQLYGYWDWGNIFRVKVWKNIV